MATISFQCLLLILALLTLVWLLSIMMKRASIIDAFWGPGFLAPSIWCIMANDSQAEPWSQLRIHQIFLLCMVIAWALRLGVHLGIRVFTEEHEDRRYAAMRQKHNPGFWWKSLLIVFWLQGVIMWLVSLPLQTALFQTTAPLSLFLTGLAIVFWCTGLFFETVGDWQLDRFRRDPNNRGKVLNRGLWRYTRHPNYFGDFMIWWGLWLFCFNIGAPWWTIVSPLLMSIFLLNVSGVRMLEKDIAERRPEYIDYIRSTSQFFPRPKRKN